MAASDWEVKQVYVSVVYFRDGEYRTQYSIGDAWSPDWPLANLLESTTDKIKKDYIRWQSDKAYEAELFGTDNLRASTEV